MRSAAASLDARSEPGPGPDPLAAGRARHQEARARARRARELLDESVVRCVAVRTIPRGRGPLDPGRAPGVEPSVWLLHVRFRRTGDPSALAQLVEEYDAYACSLAERMHREHEGREDLHQVAREGLLRALRGFDPERSLPFPAFATPTILGALRRHYRDRGWAVRVPRRVHEMATASRATEERLTGALGRAPTIAEVADELGVSVDELLDVRDAVHARNVASLDGLAAAGDGRPAGTDRALAGGDDGGRDPLLARVEDRQALRGALDQLDERDRAVVRMYFFEERSQADIARECGVSQMQVSRWLASILRRMRVWVRD